MHEFFPNMCASPKRVLVQLEEAAYISQEPLNETLIVQGFCPIVEKTVPYAVQFYEGEPAFATCVYTACKFNASAN